MTKISFSEAFKPTKIKKVASFAKASAALKSALKSAILEELAVWSEEMSGNVNYRNRRIKTNPNRRSYK